MTRVRLLEGSIARGFDGSRVRLLEGSIARGFDCSRVRLLEGSIARGFDCSRVRLLLFACRQQTKTSFCLLQRLSRTVTPGSRRETAPLIAGLTTAQIKALPRLPYIPQSLNGDCDDCRLVVLLWVGCRVLRVFLSGV